MKEPDYKTYHFTARQWILYGLLYFGGLFGVGYFFFRSFYFAFCMLPFGIVLLKNKQQTLHKNRQKDIRNQFSDVLQFLSVSLGVGSSFEKAFLEVISELELLYGTRQTLIIRELELLVTKMAMNQRMEEGLQSLADRTGCEEIQSFQNAVA